MSEKFFENKSCGFYPCHKGLKGLNCLFCYCPLYNKKDCGGNYKFINKIKTSGGYKKIKDCSDCKFPHIKNKYSKVLEKLHIKERKK